MKLGKKLSAICFAIIAAISFSFFAPPVSAAATAAKTHVSGSVTAKALNVRSGPGKTYKKIGSLKKGATVKVISTKAGWKKVSYKNRTGYVYGKYIRTR